MNDLRPPGTACENSRAVRHLNMSHVTNIREPIWSVRLVIDADAARVIPDHLASMWSSELRRVAVGGDTDDG